MPNEVTLRPGALAGDTRATSSAPTAEQRTAAAASRLGLTVVITDQKDARHPSVTLGSRDLALIGLDPGSLTERFGIDPRDFFAALAQATESGAKGARVDLTAGAATTRLYDGVDGNVHPDARVIVKDEARVTTGLGEGIALGGRALDAGAVSLWDKVLDVLVEVLSLGLADTRLFDGKIDQARWQRSGAALAMAGGPGLRRHVAPPVPAGEAVKKLEDVVRRENPDVSAPEARRIATALHGELSRIYADPRVTDALLTTLQSAFATAASGAFGGDPGAWLQARLDLGAAKAALSDDVTNAACAAEVQATLALSTPEVTALDAPTQVRIAQQLFAARGDPSAPSGFVELARNEGFRALPAPVRSTLLAAVDQQGNGGAAVRATSGAATAIARLDPAVQPLAAGALAAVPVGSAAYAATAELMQSPAFGALARERQKEVLATLAAGGHDAGLVHDVSTLMGGKAFAAAAAETQSAALTALGKTRGPEARASVLKLMDSPALGKLPAPDRMRLLDRFATSGPEVQAQLEPAITLLAKLTSHSPALDAAVTSAVVAALTSGAAGELGARVTGLDALTSAPGFGRVTAGEQRDLLTALGADGYTPGRTAKLLALLKDASFMGLHGPVRAELVTLLARAPVPAGPAAKDDLDALLRLARDDAFAGLTSAQQRTVLDTAAIKPPGYLHKLESLIAAPGFKGADVKVRDHLLAVCKRAATRQADVANLDALARAPGFDALEVVPDAQNALADFVIDHRDQAKAVNDMIAGAGDVAPENRALFVDALRRIDPSKAEQVTAFVAALTTSADFKALGKEAQASVLRLATPDTLSGLQKLVSSPAFKGLGAAGQKALTAELEKAAFGAGELARLATLTDDAGFKALTGPHQLLVMLAMAKGKGAEAQRVALTALIGHADFASLPADSKTAVLSQASNYPNPTAATHLTRMVQASWFKSMPIADRQRTAKVIGYAATKLDGSANATQKTIITNTLNRFLPPGTYTFAMGNLDLSSTSITYGENPAGTTEFRINRKLIDADDKPVESGAMASDAEHAALNTMCHEVNHAVNNVPMGETYDYFQDEYRAWYVGFVAENGRVPTRQEAYDRCTYLLSATSGAYDNLRKARVATGLDGKPTTESKKVIAFMSRFTGAALSSTDPASQGKAVNMKVGANAAAGEVELTTPAGAAPQPDPLLDMDN